MEHAWYAVTLAQHESCASKPPVVYARRLNETHCECVSDRMPVMLPRSLLARLAVKWELAPANVIPDLERAWSRKW